RPRALHPGGDLPLGQLEVEDLPGPGVAAAAGQPAAHPVGLEHLDEPPGPPLLADVAALAPGLDPAVDAYRPRRGPLVPAHYSLTASDVKVRTERRSSAESSVSQL